MPRDYKLYLEDILDSIHKIQVYTKDVTFNQVNPSSMLMDALLHNLEIIGEAAKHVPVEIKDKNPDVDWRRITGLRDIVAHEYFGVSLEIIWDVIQNKLPELQASIERIIKEE